MQTPAIPRSLLRRWFGLVRDEPERLSSSRYLVLGPELTETLELPLPSAASVTDLLRTLRDREPDVLPHAEKLARGTAAGREALLELAVDELLRATGDWPHPCVVLEPPRPEYRALVPVCERRRRPRHAKPEVRVPDRRHDVVADGDPRVQRNVDERAAPEHPRQAGADERGHVDAVIRKVVKAAEISEEARRRRERRRLGRQR